MTCKIFTAISFFLCCCLLNYSTYAFQLYDELTPEERDHFFPNSNGSSRNYDVVPIHVTRNQTDKSNSTYTLKVRAFNKNFKLFLKPIEGTLVHRNTPVYYSTFQNGRVVLTQDQTALRSCISDIYLNEKYKASIVIDRSASGKKMISGYIGGAGMSIKPLPMRLTEKYARYRRSISENPELDEQDHHYHVVFSVDSEHEDKEMFLGINDKKSIAEKSLSRIKRDLPEVVYPEVLVVVDSELFHAFGWDWGSRTVDDREKAVLRYVLSYWNSVDMRYRSLEDPQWRINIAGIVIATEDRALPYIYDNIKTNQKYYGEKLLNSFPALIAAKKFWYEQNYQIPLNSYDVLMTMTKLKSCGMDEDNICQLNSVRGQAYVGSVCNEGNGRETEKVGWVYDDGCYGTVGGAAHELGHQLGAPHDTYDTDCEWDHQYVMVPFITFANNTNFFQWSPCSEESLRKTLRSPNGLCLFNEPNYESIDLRLLPGRLLNADEQCRRASREFIRSCQPEGGICIHLGCLKNDGECEVLTSPAADGTPCAKDKLCVRGECIPIRRINY